MSEAKRLPHIEMKPYEQQDDEESVIYLRQNENNRKLFREEPMTRSVEKGFSYKKDRSHLRLM